MAETPGILLVTYDLKGTSAQYTKLYELLQGQNSWWHYLASTWLVATSKTPNQLSEEMRPLTLEADKFLVVRFSTEYWGWVTKEAWDWIKTHQQ